MSVTKIIRTDIEKRGEGAVFLTRDFAHLGTEDAVKKALSRLCEEGFIIRLGKGIYCSPAKDETFGFGTIYPSREQIAFAVARSEGISILPTGDFAMNALHLTTQVQNNSVFLTDGCRRNIKLYGYKGKGITFIHCSNRRIFLIQNRMMLLIILSMKEIGENNISEAQMGTIKSHLSKVSLQDYLHDIKLAPAWIQRKLTA